MSDQKITLYPGNWLYNAATIGFITSLIQSNKIDEQCFSQDGSIQIPSSIFFEKDIGENKLIVAIEALINYVMAKEENRDEWLNKKDKKGSINREKYIEFEKKMPNFGYKFIRAGNNLFASKTPYQNLVQLSEWQSLEFNNFIRDGIKFYFEGKGSFYCSLCAHKSGIILNPDSKLQNRLIRLQEPHLRMLAPSDKFPNSFWNNSTSMHLCPLCSFLILHSHIPFIPIGYRQDIFINAPSFKISYFLNQYASQVFDKSSARDILAMSLMEFSQKFQASLGVWSLSNIEIIKIVTDKDEKSIEHIALPYQKTRLLLNRRISSLITWTKEPFVFNTVINGDLEDLLRLNERILKTVQTGDIKEKENYIRFLKNKQITHLIKLSQILPELYILIDKQMKEEVIR